MYKLLALDMDDTFLNSKKVITNPVKEGLQKLLYRNIDITLASGRFPASLWLHAKYIGMKFPLIALNGAVIVDPITGEALNSYYIDFEVAERIAKFVEEMGSYVQFYGFNELFVNKVNEVNSLWPLKNVVINPDKDLTYDNYRTQANYTQIHSVGRIVDFIKSREHKVLKATVLEENIDVVEKLYDEIKSWPEISVSRTGSIRFDINAKGITKQTGLEKVCSEKGILPKEVVTVGDFDNDIEMIEWAGLGVAMGNGNSNVKRIANYITDTNDNNGVAKVVYEHFLS